ncbi:MAG: nitroreductase [Deltaproteobacteria bacterium]|nr:nitroreductase [Deltaproteobacteria bacterium]
MDLFKAIEERKSTRAYLERSLEREVIERLLHLATRSPSAINLQPWEFIVVSGEERKRLSRMLVKLLRERKATCGPSVKEPLPLYFKRRQKDLLESIAPLLPEGAVFQEFINEGSCNFYGAPTAIILTIDHAFSSRHFTDIGITMGWFMLAAHAMGLGTCPIGIIYPFQNEIKENLNIPDRKEIVASMAVGYPDPEASVNRARSGRVPVSDIVKWRG